MVINLALREGNTTGGSNFSGGGAADILLEGWVLEISTKARLLLPQFLAACG